MKKPLNKYLIASALTLAAAVVVLKTSLLPKTEVIMTVLLAGILIHVWTNLSRLAQNWFSYLLMIIGAGLLFYIADWGSLAGALLIAFSFWTIRQATAEV